MEDTQDELVNNGNYCLAEAGKNASGEKVNGALDYHYQQLISLNRAGELLRVENFSVMKYFHL
jgi:hypothetical protein